LLTTSPPSLEMRAGWALLPTTILPLLKCETEGLFMATTTLPCSNASCPPPPPSFESETEGPGGPFVNLSGTPLSLECEKEGFCHPPPPSQTQNRGSLLPRECESTLRGCAFVFDAILHTPSMETTYIEVVSVFDTLPHMPSMETQYPPTQVEHESHPCRGGFRVHQYLALE